MHRKKKPVEFHFVDMNDPDRYKKLKVTRACDFCRRRKAKCDIGIPGSGTCSNCSRHQMVCIFSPVTTSRGSDPARPEDTLLTPQPPLEQLAFRFPLLRIKNGQVGYELNHHLPKETVRHTPDTHQEPSLQLESKLFSIYFEQVHPAYPVLLKQSVQNIHSQDRLLLSRGLRYAIMTLACHFYPTSVPSTPYMFPYEQDLSSNNRDAAIYFYDTAKWEVDNAISKLGPKLDTVQALLLLFKHSEIMMFDGIQYLERAQEMVCKVQSVVPQQQEMINRARWILFGTIGLSNLSNSRFDQMYKQVILPSELPQALQEELQNDHNDPTAVSSAHQHVNRFAQIANLSLLYSHTVYSLMTGSANLICLKQFKEIRQHWHDSLHPVTQSKLISLCATDDEDIDIMILYSAILYDMLYLMLVLHDNLLETEWDAVETAYRLQRMVHNWVTRPSFLSAVQCRRMASLALMLALQLQVCREEDKVDHGFVQQVRHTFKYTSMDIRVDKELHELYLQLTAKKSSSLSVQQQQQQPIDYFSLVPQSLMQSTASSSPLDFPSSSTPGLWDILSTTTNGGLATPIREDDSIAQSQTFNWIFDQQRQQEHQLQLYHLQQQAAYFTPILPATFGNHTTSPSNTTDTSQDAQIHTTPESEDLISEEESTTVHCLYLNNDLWSSTTIEHLNQMKL